MPRFMLDMNTCSYIMKRSNPLVLKRLQSVRVGDVCMSELALTLVTNNTHEFERIARLKLENWTLHGRRSR